MPRPSNSKRKTAIDKVNFRHQVDPDSPLGRIYTSVGKTPGQKKLIEESLINSLLPYAYKDQNPELAREAAQSCVKKLLDWVAMLQLDFGLDDAMISRAGGFNAAFAERLIEEVQLLRQAFTEKSHIVDELRLIRETISAIQRNRGMILAMSTDSPPLPLNTKLKDTEIFVRGDNFLADLEEVL